MPVPMPQLRIIEKEFTVYSNDEKTSIFCQDCSRYLDPETWSVLLDTGIYCYDCSVKYENTSNYCFLIKYHK